MTRDTAAALVMQRLGKRTGLDTDVALELQQAQSDLELGTHLPWFLKKDLSLTTVASVRYVSLPSDFLRETEELLWITTSNGVRQLVKGQYDELYNREIFDSDYLQSYYYAVVGTKLYVFPLPASAMAITGFYFAQDAVLSAGNSENNWSKYVSGLLIARAGLRMSKTLRDGEAFGLFKADYEEAFGEMLKSDVAREQAAMSAIMGG